MRMLWKKIISKVIWQADAIWWIASRGKVLKVSSKVKWQLMHEGCTLNKQKDLKDEVIAWECEKRQKDKICKARVNT